MKVNSVLHIREQSQVYNLHNFTDKTALTTFQDFPRKTGSSWFVVSKGNRLAFWYQINWKCTCVGGAGVVALPSPTTDLDCCITDLGINTDVRGSWNEVIYDHELLIIWNAIQKRDKQL